MPGTLAVSFYIKIIHFHPSVCVCVRGVGGVKGPKAMEREQIFGTRQRAVGIGSGTFINIIWTVAGRRLVRVVYPRHAIILWN